MRYKCCNCDCVFDEQDAGERSECVGEFWGSPAYQTYMVCPECDSEEIDEYTEDEEQEDEEDGE